MITIDKTNLIICYNNGDAEAYSKEEYNTISFFADNIRNNNKLITYTIYPFMEKSKISMKIRNQLSSRRQHDKEIIEEVRNFKKEENKVVLKDQKLDMNEIEKDLDTL